MERANEAVAVVVGAGVPDRVAVGVALSGVGDRGAVVDHIADRVGVGVGEQTIAVGVAEPGLDPLD